MKDRTTLPTALLLPVVSSFAPGYHNPSTVSLAPKPTPVRRTVEPALPEAGDRTMAGLTWKAVLAVLPLVCPTAMRVCVPAMAWGTVNVATKAPRAVVVGVIRGVVLRAIPEDLHRLAGAEVGACHHDGLQGSPARWADDHGGCRRHRRGRGVIAVWWSASCGGRRRVVVGVTVAVVVAGGRVGSRYCRRSLHLHGADVTGRAARGRAGIAALVGRQDTVAQRHGVDGRAARQRRHGQGRSAVVLQGTQEWIERAAARAHLVAVDTVGQPTAVADAHEVVPARGQRARAIRAVGCGVPCQDRVGQRQRAMIVVDAAAIDGRAIAGDGAVGQRQCAISCRCRRRSSAHYCRRRCCWSASACHRVDDAATIDRARYCRRRCCWSASACHCCRYRRRLKPAIAGDGAVGQRQRATVEDAAAVGALLPETVLLVSSSVPC